MSQCNSQEDDVEDVVNVEEFVESRNFCDSETQTESGCISPHSAVQAPHLLHFQVLQTKQLKLDRSLYNLISVMRPEEEEGILGTDLIEKIQELFHGYVHSDSLEASDLV